MYLRSALSPLMASSSPSPPPRRRDHRVGGLRAIPEPIVQHPIRGISNADGCLVKIQKEKAASTRTTSAAYTTVNYNAVMEVVPLFDKLQKGGGERARNLYNEKPTEFPWKSWPLTVRALKEHTHEVDENGKLCVIDKKKGRLQVLPIEQWHSTFVGVYSTHADFSARYAARRTMNTTIANQVIDKMTVTYYLNKSLLLKCILVNEEDVPTINPAPALLVPQERMMEEEQPNAMQLVATSGDGRRGTVATESFAAAQSVGNGNGVSYYAEGSNPIINNNYYSGAPSNNNNTATGTGTALACASAPTIQVYGNGIGIQQIWNIESTTSNTDTSLLREISAKLDARLQATENENDRTTTNNNNSITGNNNVSYAGANIYPNVGRMCIIL